MTSTGPAVASGASMVPPSRANSIKAIGQIPQVSNGYLEHSVGKGSVLFIIARRYERHADIMLLRYR